MIIAPKKTAISHTGNEKAPDAPIQGNAEGHVYVDSPSYRETGKKVNRPENGLEFLFICPVDDGLEAQETYKEMKKNCDRGILVMVFRNNCSAIAVDLKTRKWKQYEGRPSERELTKLQKGSLNSCHPRHDPEGYFKVMKQHGVESNPGPCEIESFSRETEFYCLSCGQDFKPVTDETLCERCSRQEHGDLLHCR
jgi:hypothetical protein